LKGLLTNRTIQFSKSSRRFTAKNSASVARFIPTQGTKNLTADFFVFSSRLVSFKLWVLYLIDFQPNVNRFFGIFIYRFLPALAVRTAKGEKE
jgi:hypothetical protein